MKGALMLSIVSLALSTGAIAQKNDAPNAVQKAFSQKYPDAKEVKWEQENANEWEAEFEIGEEEMSANFTNDGHWISSEQEIEEEKIPSNIYQALQASYPGCKIKEAELGQSQEHPLFYELEIKAKTGKLTVFVDNTGKVFKEETTDND